MTEDADWFDWSASMLARAARDGRLVVNPLIYAEVSCGYTRIEDLDEALPAVYFTREPLPWAAAFLAARAFVGYRRRGGTRAAPLPDFYIGAHAAVEGIPLLTRDPTRYRRYLPRLALISP